MEKIYIKSSLWENYRTIARPTSKVAENLSTVIFILLRVFDLILVKISIILLKCWGPSAAQIPTKDQLDLTLLSVVWHIDLNTEWRITILWIQFEATFMILLTMRTVLWNKYVSWPLEQDLSTQKESTVCVNSSI